MKQCYIHTHVHMVHFVCLNHPRKKTVRRPKGDRNPRTEKSLIEERAGIVEKGLIAAAALAVDETRIRARLNAKISRKIET